MSEVTIEITQYCPYICSYCSSNASPQGKHLSKEKIFAFLENISDREIERINISGGEPLSHPNFYEILNYCEGITDNVWVYTNAIRNIIYNSNVIRDLQIHANICPIAGESAYFPKPQIEVKTHILKLIHQGRAENTPPQNMTVSRNFWDEDSCEDCNHILLQADGETVHAPCKKEYQQ